MTARPAPFLFAAALRTNRESLLRNRINLPPVDLSTIGETVLTRPKARLVVRTTVQVISGDTR